MPTVTVLNEAVRGSVAFGHAGDQISQPFKRNSGPTGPFLLTFPSADWQQNGHTMDVAFEWSFDNGQTWEHMGGFDGVSGEPSRWKDGLIHHPAMQVYWDGTDCQVRGSITVNAPFSWGLTVTTP